MIQWDVQNVEKQESKDGITILKDSLTIKHQTKKSGFWGTLRKEGAPRTFVS